MIQRMLRGLRAKVDQAKPGTSSTRGREDTVPLEADGGHIVATVAVARLQDARIGSTRSTPCHDGG